MKFFWSNAWPPILGGSYFRPVPVHFSPLRNLEWKLLLYTKCILLVVATEAQSHKVSQAVVVLCD